jgi:hypothetical protein
MTQLDSRPAECDGHPHAPPLPCPFGRHLSFATGQYGIVIGYEDLTRIMDRVFGIWDHLEDSGVMDDKAGDMFESLVGHLTQTREWTGWNGVPGEFTR